MFCSVCADAAPACRGRFPLGFVDVARALYFSYRAGSCLPFVCDLLKGALRAIPERGIFFPSA